MRTRDAKNCLGLFDRLDPDGMASDTSETDLQRKAAWLGGDLAVVTMASQEARASTSWYKSVTTTAEVFWCEGAQ